MSIVMHYVDLESTGIRSMPSIPYHKELNFSDFKKAGIDNTWAMNVYEPSKTICVFPVIFAAEKDRILHFL